MFIFFGLCRGPKRRAWVEKQGDGGEELQRDGEQSSVPREETGETFCSGCGWLGLGAGVKPRN